MAIVNQQCPTCGNIATATIRITEERQLLIDALEELISASASDELIRASATFAKAEAAIAKTRE